MSGKILAQIGKGVIGGTADAGSQQTFQNVISTIIFYVFVAGGLFMLYHLVVGALNWINSQGEKEKLVKAQGQIKNAVIGFVVLFGVWALFFILIQVFGFAEVTSTGFKIQLPTLIK